MPLLVNVIIKNSQLKDILDHWSYKTLFVVKPPFEAELLDFLMFFLYQFFRLKDFKGDTYELD